MNSVFAFVIVMLVWTIADVVSKSTKSLLSSLFVASLIFLIGFKSNIFPKTLLPDSSLLALGSTVVGFIIVHIGTMVSVDELKRQWKTFVIGVSAVLGVGLSLYLVRSAFPDINYFVGAVGAVTGGTVSIIIVQQAVGVLMETANASQQNALIMVAAFPVLISAFQGLIGFPLTSIILKKEALRVRGLYREGKLEQVVDKVKKTERTSKLPSFLKTTQGTLFIVGVVVLLAMQIDKYLGLNTFIVALLLGVLLRELKWFPENVLSGIDAYGLMMLAILIIVFGPLAQIDINQLIELIVPILIAFSVGVGGNIIASMIAGKAVGYSLAMSVAIGLTSLYGFPGTMILSQEASKSVGENEAEIQAIEAEILPKMIIAGFATVTITSVFITGLLVRLITL